MGDKFSNIKERILYITDIKGVSKHFFFNSIGMTYASFKGSAKDRPLNSNAIEKILTLYPDINPTWLLLGKGLMLLQNDMLNDVALPSEMMKLPLISRNISHLVMTSKVPKDALGAEFGLKRGAIGSYMTGKSSPKLETLIKISERFGISTDDLLKKDLSTLSDIIHQELPSENVESKDEKALESTLNRLERLSAENALLRAKVSELESKLSRK